MGKYYFWFGVFIVIAIIFKAFESDIKGKFGEGRVNGILKKLPEGYITLKDLLLETGGGTTQIDHVVVSPKGIFVIETKNYEGWIYGSENQKYWTQVIYKNKNKFFNPVWQNAGHISAIMKNIKRLDLPIYSIVAFSGKCTLKKINCETPVIYIGEIKKYITNFHGERSLNVNEVNKIVGDLKRANITDDGRRKEHIKYVKSKK